MKPEEKTKERDRHSVCVLSWREREQANQVFISQYMPASVRASHSDAINILYMMSTARRSVYIPNDEAHVLVAVVAVVAFVNTLGKLLRNP